MEIKEFVEKFKAIFPDVTDEAAEGGVQEFISAAERGAIPAIPVGKENEMLVLYEEISAALPKAPVAPEESLEGTPVPAEPVAEGSTSEEAPKE